MAELVESYDPRIWAAQWRARAAGGDAGDADPRRLRRQRLLSLGIAGSLIAAGAAAAWLSRGDGSVAEPARPTAAAGGTAAVAVPTDLRRTLLLSKAGDLPAALAGADLPPEVVEQVAAAAAPALRPTGEVRAVLVLRRSGGGLEFARLEASNGDSSGVIVSRSAAGEITAAPVAAQVQTRILVKHGTMDGDSFYSSAVAVGVPNSLIPVFAKALAFDFDFQREVAAGDAFEVAYAQAVNAAGDLVGAPTLLYASLTTATKSATVYRFAPAGGQSEWFDASGQSIIRALMRTPVDGARVSSKFGYRFHPILKYQKLHGGIDFAAPRGTPIYASGNGTVVFAAPKGPNGNFVKIHHDNGWETLYLHMNQFAPGIVAGVRVVQGQQIGEVGTTGRSTGPHLHFEVLVQGAPQNPARFLAGGAGPRVLN